MCTYAYVYMCICIYEHVYPRVTAVDQARTRDTEAWVLPCRRSRQDDRKSEGNHTCDNAAIAREP